jgi:hypothetical protein
MPTTSNNSQPAPGALVFEAATGVEADVRRSEVRFSLPESSDIVLWTGQSVTITDESFSGIGLHVKAGGSVKPGHEVCVDYQGKAAAGIVRSVQQEEPELWRIGLEWKEPGGPFQDE